MAGTTVIMMAEKQFSLREIRDKLNSSCIAGEVSCFSQSINNVEMMMIVYEKFYFRSSGYANISVTFTEYGNKQTVHIVSFGGGDGAVNWSYGANRDFAKKFVSKMENLGFIVTESNIDTKNKNFYEIMLE